MEKGGHFLLIEMGMDSSLNLCRAASEVQGAAPYTTTDKIWRRRATSRSSTWTWEELVDFKFWTYLFVSSVLCIFFHVMVVVRGRPIFLDWGLREHAPASCYINPGELELHCVCVFWGAVVVVRMVCVWLSCAKGGVLVMSSRTAGPGAQWGWSRCWAVLFL